MGQARRLTLQEREGPPRGMRLGTGRGEEASWISSGAIPRATAAGFFDRQARDKDG